MGLLLPAFSRQEAGADDQGPERIHAPPGLLVLLQRRGVRPQPRVVGPGQRHVVERLSALELDLAEFAQGDPARSRSSAAGDAAQVLAGNVCKLYGLDVAALPAGIAAAAAHA